MRVHNRVLPTPAATARAAGPRRIAADVALIEHMDISHILFVGVKGHVVAFGKEDGRLLWKTKLERASLTFGDRFVTVLVEGQRVYAHSYGRLFCLDAATGRQLWTNKLEGLSYDIASLATEGVRAPSQAALARYLESKSHGAEGAGSAG